MLTNEYLLNYHKSLYETSVKKEFEFFDVPNVLDLLLGASIAGAYALLDEYKEKLQEALQSYDSKVEDSSRKSPISHFNTPSNISSDEIRKAVKTDKKLRDFMKNVDKDVNNEGVSEIIKACGNEEEYYSDKKEKIKKSLENKDFDPQVFIKNVEEESDLEKRAEKNRGTIQLFNNNQDLLSKIESGIYMLIIVYFLIDNLISFLESTEFPSYYRSNFLQKITSNILTSLKEIESETLIPEAQNLVSSLKIVDAIVISIVTASFLYLENRKKLQKLSSESFKNAVTQLNCEEPQTELSPEEVDPSVHNPFKMPFDSSSKDTSIENFSCPINTSDERTPHKPFENQIQNFTCELPGEEDQDTDFDQKIQEDTARKAKINNLSDETFEKYIKNGEKINVGDKIGKVGNLKIYSPIVCEVYKIENNAIYVKNIEESNTDFIKKPLENIKDSYEKLKNTKEFLKTFYIQSYYPILLSNIEKDMPEDLENTIIETLEQLGYLPTSIINQLSSSFPDIEYLIDGVSKRYDVMLSDYEDAKEQHDENVKEITSKKNVENKAEKEETSKIKEELDNEEEDFFNKLKQLSNRGENQSSVTLGRQDDYILSEYYIELFSDLSTFYEQNDIISEFRDKIREFSIDRVFKEKYDLKNIKEKINEYTEKLTGKKKFDEIDNKYENNNKDKKVIENYLKNNTLDDIENNKRDKLINKILSLFLLYKKIHSLKDKDYEIEVNTNELLIRESNYIENFLSQYWKDLNNLKEKINNNINNIKEKSQSFVQPTSELIDNEEFKVYTVKGRERECPEPKEDHPNLSPFSQYEKGDIQYWLKYCGIATLVSLTNPSGWSTGLTPPIGPILFPVVYIPIISFYTDYGFIVIGITVTGVYVFPFVLFSNLSTQYRVPIADPAAFIRKQINNLKDTIVSSLQSYRHISLKNYLDKTEDQLEEADSEVENLNENLRQLRKNKPKKDRTKNNPYFEISESSKGTQAWSNDDLDYVARLGDWEERKQELNASLVLKKSERYALEIKHKIVYEAYKGAPMQNPDDPDLIALKEIEESIENSFEQLNQLIKSVDEFIKPLPISLTPQSGNFAYTVKNPKPVIEIKSDFSTNEVINQDVVDNVFEQFKLDKSVLMSSNLKGKTQDSILNFAKYKGTLAPLMNYIIPIDPFPKYENLKITYIPWTLKFLYPHWATVGAQTFGFPGFPPFPTS